MNIEIKDTINEIKNTIKKIKKMNIFVVARPQCGRKHSEKSMNMNNKNLFAAAALWVTVMLMSAGCEKSGTLKSDDAPGPEVAEADQYAIDVLGTYYLWNEEIEKDLARLDPDTCKMPVEVVESIRYHEGGKEVDRWTILTDDLESFSNSVQGLGLTYGYDLQAGRILGRDGEYFLVVSFVSDGGPAQEAGLKRGDVIITLDGNAITADNIYDAYDSRSVSLGVTSVERDRISSDVRTVSLNAVDMYEDPILVTRTFDVAGKKVGYLAYTSFDLKSSLTLPDVFRDFKSMNIDELIIDLRYNGGGYAFTENVLASMIAPLANVMAGDIFQTEVYNSILSEAWEKQGEDTNTYFSTVHEISSQKLKIDVSDANLGIGKIYVIVTGGTASASEGLIVGLKPYMDVVLVGEQTYGKYCAGILLAPEDLYKSTYDYSLIKDWGMYVMISKFADCNGRNESIPDGIPVDVEVEDNPFDGCQLGDENETMLRAALQAAGMVYPQTASVTRSCSRSIGLTSLERGVPGGLLIKTDVPALRLR